MSPIITTLALVFALAAPPAQPIKLVPRVEGGWPRPDRTCLGFTPDGETAYLLWDHDDENHGGHNEPEQRIIRVDRVKLKTGAVRTVRWIANEVYVPVDPNRNPAYPPEVVPGPMLPRIELDADLGPGTDSETSHTLAFRVAETRLRRALPKLNTWLANEKLTACEEASDLKGQRGPWLDILKQACNSMTVVAAKLESRLHAFYLVGDLLIARPLTNDGEFDSAAGEPSLLRTLPLGYESSMGSFFSPDLPQIWYQTGGSAAIIRLRFGKVMVYRP